MRRHFISIYIGAIASILFVGLPPASASDHNDPNAVNSIFSDVNVSAADLYDMFAFPADGDSDRVVLALTFAAAPKAGVFDTDMLYRVLVASGPRVVPPGDSDSVESMLGYVTSLEANYLKLKPCEVRVRFDSSNRAKVEFIGFPGGALTQTIDTDKSVSISAPDGAAIKIFVGGRDDPFFNDLTGFFRSINYGPQFYHVSVNASPDLRELHIPKSLLELDGNDLFNFDPSKPQLGYTLKNDLPAGPLEWKGTKYKKDAKGNYRFMYSGKDARAGKNANAIVVELPLSYLTKSPAENRIVHAWGESYVLRAAHKISEIPDNRSPTDHRFLVDHPLPVPIAIVALGLLLAFCGLRGRARSGALPSSSPPAAAAALFKRPWGGHPILLTSAGAILVVLGGVGAYVLTAIHNQSELVEAKHDPELMDFKLIDTDGQPFADAALNERENSRQLGANNFSLAPHLIARLGHLGWGFGPSISALGLKGSFNHDTSPISIYKVYNEKNPVELAEAFVRCKKTLFQKLNMPDDSWNKKGLAIPLRRPVDIFIPNVISVDMDTTGTWPFGHRLEDQVATSFLSLFLDMSADANGKKYNIEILSDQGVLDTLPLEPKTPPNPLKNDKEFLKKFPYLAEPWPDVVYQPGNG